MSAVKFPQTRAEALAQLTAFLPHAPGYAEVRNRVEAGHAGVSRLSPAIRCRLVTEDEVITETLRQHALPAVEKWVQEIFWRRYWKGWLELRPKVWTLYRSELARLRAELPPEVLQRAEDVAAGRSGVVLMDRFARELTETGYLHNHARMWWASFWVHVEQLPWELGADFFYRHLLDADPASNTLSWRWVAGLQTKGKAYLVRRSNLDRYCAPDLLADPTGLERLADDAVQPFRLAVDPDDEVAVARELEKANAATPSRFPRYPSRPEEELPGRVGLWIHGEDATPELSTLGELKPAAIAAFQAAELADEWRLSSGRIAYQQAVLADATQRATAHYGVAAQVHETASLATGLVAWAQREKLAAVVAFAPAVGPLQDQQAAIGAALQEAGVELRLFRRNTDFELWPHAKEGYFNFWDEVKLWLRAKQKRGEFLPTGGAGH